MRGPSGEHCCLNIKQAVLSPMWESFWLFRRAPRRVPPGPGVQCPPQSSELILGIYLSTSQSRGQEDRSFLSATDRMTLGGGGKGPGIGDSFLLFPSLNIRFK